MNQTDTLDNKNNKKIRVLHVILTLEVGGLENGVINLVNGLDANLFESVICCIQHSGELAKRITNPSAKIVQLNYYGGYDFKTPLRLASLIKKEKIDVIHTRNLKASYFGFLASKFSFFTPLVHSEHGRDYPFSPKKMLMQRIFSWGTDVVVALSSDLKECLVKYVKVSPKKIKVIVNGVDTNKFLPQKSLSNKAALGLPDNALVIGAVGRLVEVKNIEELLHATSQCIAINENIHLLIIGDGPSRESLELLTQQLGISNHVHFLGSRNDLPFLLNNIDIYTLTSFNEGISNTLLEAMSSGLPVIVSKVGGNPEIVTHQQNGLLYESGQVKQLSSSIIELINSQQEREELGLKARHYILDKRSIGSMIHHYQELYQAVV